MRSLFVKGLTRHSVLFHRCSCGTLNMLGCWDQLDPIMDYEHRRCFVRVVCEKCQKVNMKRYFLTTGTWVRHCRWAEWGFVLWAFLVQCHAPQSLVQSIMRVSCWLEENVRV